MAVANMPLYDLSGKRVLEIRPQSGGHSALFAKYGAIVTSTDIAPERTNPARTGETLGDGSLEDPQQNVEGEKKVRKPFLMARSSESTN